MQCKLKLLAFMGIATILIGCGSTRLSENLAFASTNNKIPAQDEVKKENRHAEKCTWFIFGIPLGALATPQEAFNKLNDGAVYINNLSFNSGGWSFGSRDKPIVGKACWIAKGTALIKE